MQSPKLPSFFQNMQNMFIPVHSKTNNPFIRISFQSWLQMWFQKAGLHFFISHTSAIGIFEPFRLLKDERGIDGVIILDESKKKVLVGTRMAATKEKKTQHEDKNAQDEDFQKVHTGLKVEHMDQAGSSASWSRFMRSLE